MKTRTEIDDKRRELYEKWISSGYLREAQKWLMEQPELDEETRKSLFGFFVFSLSVNSTTSWTMLEKRLTPGDHASAKRQIKNL